MVLISVARIRIFHHFFLKTTFNLINIPKNSYKLSRVLTQIVKPPDESIFLSLIDNSKDTMQEMDILKTNNNKFNVFVLQLRMQFKSKSRQSTQAELQLSESISLVNTIQDWKVVGSFIKSAKHSYSNQIFGEETREKLSKLIAASGANILFVVIDRLTISQTENIRKMLCGNNNNFMILDRYKIVLEIFKRNAKTKVAKLQIALAEIPYIRHQFDNKELYKNLEKKLKNEINILSKNKSVTNLNRTSKKFPLVSIFGYTNVGKTSLIKCLTNDEKITPENKLFSTLDITYHGFKTGLNSGQGFILIDSIGFISDIPLDLIEAFKITILDAIKADIFIHVVDISHPDWPSQQNSVNRILKSLAPEDKVKDMLTIYNKSDIKDKNIHDLNNNEILTVSCKTGSGIIELKQKIETMICKKLEFIKIIVRVRQGSDEFSYLYKNALIKEIDDCKINSDFILLKILISKTNALKFIKLYPKVKVIKQN